VRSECESDVSSWSDHLAINDAGRSRLGCDGSDYVPGGRSVKGIVWRMTWRLSAVLSHVLPRWAVPPWVTRAGETWRTLAAISAPIAVKNTEPKTSQPPVFVAARSRTGVEIDRHW
jgi:hypothetical protein